MFVFLTCFVGIPSDTDSALLLTSDHRVSFNTSGRALVLLLCADISVTGFKKYIFGVQYQKKRQQ